jgi:hypothetical protein
MEKCGVANAILNESSVITKLYSGARQAIYRYLSMQFSYLVVQMSEDDNGQLEISVFEYLNSKAYG